MSPATTRALLATLGLSVALSMLACSSTRLTSVYLDKSFTGGPFRQLLVVGLGASPGGRAEFENAVVDKLSAQNVLAVASSNVIVSVDDVNRENLRTWVERDGYDAVMITRLADVKKQQTYYPPTYGDIYGYWGYYGAYVASPGYAVETTTLVLETTLFDASTGKVVYSAESRSFQPDSRNELIHELVPLLVGDLTDRGFL